MFIIMGVYHTVSTLVDLIVSFFGLVLQGVLSILEITTTFMMHVDPSKKAAIFIFSAMIVLWLIYLTFKYGVYLYVVAMILIPGLVSLIKILATVYVFYMAGKYSKKLYFKIKGSLRLKSAVE